MIPDIIIILVSCISFLVDGRDYYSSRATNNTHTFTVIGDNIYVTIPIINNRHRDGQRFFLFGIRSDHGIGIWLQIFIWDDEQGKLIIIANATNMHAFTKGYAYNYTHIHNHTQYKHIHTYVCNCMCTNTHAYTHKHSHICICMRT